MKSSRGGAGANNGGLFSRLRETFSGRCLFGWRKRSGIAHESEAERDRAEEALFYVDALPGVGGIAAVVDGDEGFHASNGAPDPAPARNSI